MSILLDYDEIRIGRKKLIESGCITLHNTGVYLIRGENGIGKTLLLNNIFSKYASISCYVPQDKNAIFSELSVVENISMGDKTKISFINQLFEQNNMQDFACLNAKKLSGGEKRLVCILRAVVSGAQFLILDEPTNDLDSNKINILISIIQRYKLEKTFLIVTHDERLFNICDIQYVIKNGILEKVVDKDVSLPDDETIEKVEDYNYRIQKDIGKLISFPLFLELGFYLVLFMIVLRCFFLNNVKDDQGLSALGNKNQIDFYMPESFLGSGLETQGAMPISIVLEMLDKKGLMNEDSNEITLKSTSSFDIYPLEFYDTSTMEYLLVFDLYIEKIMCMDPNECCVDTSSIMSIEDTGYGSRKIKFDEHTYQKTIDYIERTYPFAVPVFVVVIIKDGYSEDDFFSYVEKIPLNKNIYVYSDKTVEIYSFLKIIIDNRNELIRIIVEIICLLMILALSVYIWLRFNRIKILAFRNMGVCKKHLKKWLFPKFLYKMILPIFPLLFFIYQSLNSKLNRMAWIAILAVLYMLGYILMILIEKMIEKIQIMQLYSWRFR